MTQFLHPCEGSEPSQGSRSRTPFDWAQERLRYALHFVPRYSGCFLRSAMLTVPTLHRESMLSRP